MHNCLVIALRKLACGQGNDEAVVYGECRDIDGRCTPVACVKRRIDQAGRRDHEVDGEVGMAHWSH